MGLYQTGLGQTWKWKKIKWPLEAHISLCCQCAKILQTIVLNSI